MASYKSATIKAANSGDLMTRISEENPGLQNYVKKQNWRKRYDQEVRREGDAYFQPRMDKPLGNQPYPNIDEFGVPITDEPITMFHNAKAPNGRSAIMAGTPTKLFRFFFLEDAAYVNLTLPDSPYDGAAIINADQGLSKFYIPGDWTNLDGQNWFKEDYVITISNGAGNDGVYTVDSDSVYNVGNDWTEIEVVEAIPTPYAGGVEDGEITSILDDQGNDLSQITEYFLDFNGWVKIGDGYSVDGHRWEAHAIGETVIFNNGIDLPLQYNINGFEVFPIYELRESGFAHVDNITEFNGMLLAADVTEVRADKLSELMLGNNELYPDPYGYYNDQQRSNRIQYRMIFSPQGEPTRWAPLVNGSIEAGSTILLLEYPMMSFQKGDTLLLTGAGPSGVNLEDEILQIGLVVGGPFVPDDGGTGYVDAVNVHTQSNGNGLGLHVNTTTSGGVITEFEIINPGFGYEAGETITIGGGNEDATYTLKAEDVRGIRLVDPVDTTINNLPIQKADNASLSPTPGYIDLQDDSSGILRMTKLQDRLVVLKDTTIMVVRFTGSLDEPFDPRIVYRGNRTLFWKWSLTAPKGEYLLYGGEKDFLRFDLTSRTPKEVAKLTLCSNIFYDNTDVEEMDQVYASLNSITEEVWFCFPGKNDISGLMYNYTFDDCSTIDKYYSASETVKIPRLGVGLGPTEDWFLVGDTIGTVLINGRAAEPQLQFGNSESLYVREARYSAAIKTGQSGNVVISDGEIFLPSDVGRIILWDSQEKAVVTSYIDPETVLVDTSTTISPDSILIFKDYYDFELESGWGAFRDEFNAKDLRSFALHLASQSPNADLTVKLFGNRNAVEEISVPLVSQNYLDPDLYNLIPTFFRHIYYKHNVKGSNQHLNSRLSAVTWEWSKKRTRSNSRFNDGA